MYDEQRGVIAGRQRDSEENLRNVSIQRKMHKELYDIDMETATIEAQRMFAL